MEGPHLKLAMMVRTDGCSGYWLPEISGKRLYSSAIAQESPSGYIRLTRFSILWIERHEPFYRLEGNRNNAADSPDMGNWFPVDPQRRIRRRTWCLYLWAIPDSVTCYHTICTQSGNSSLNKNTYCQYGYWDHADGFGFFSGKGTSNHQLSRNSLLCMPECSDHCCL